MKPSCSRAEARHIYISAGICSLLFSIWIAMRDTIINNDGVCYVLSAREYGVSGLSAAMHLCGQAMWPLYSVLIYYFSRLTFLSEIHAALVMNAGFTLISVVSFLAIVRLLGATRRVMWLAAFVILFAHQFNSVREYIIRDHGFWAFYLLSMFFLLRFMAERRWYQAVAFSVSLLIATLFRIEGAVFLAVLPFLCLLNGQDWKQRGYDFLRLNAVTLTIVALLLVWMIAHPADSIHRLGRVAELVYQSGNALQVIADRYHHNVAMLGQYVLPNEALRDAGVLWVVSVIVLYVINVVSNLSFAATALVVYAWLTGVTAYFARSARLTLFGYLAVNVFVTAIFFAEHLFLSKRYLIAMTLVFLLWVPFALDKLLRAGASLRVRALGQLAMAVMLVSCMGVLLGLGASKLYIREAGDWLAQHVPANARLYSNDKLLAFYSGQYGNNVFRVMEVNRDIQAMVQGKLHEYDVAALRSGREEDDRLAVVLNEMHAQVVKKFMNKRGDNVVIYNIPRSKMRS